MATNWKAVLLASMIATTTFGARNVLAAPTVSAEQTSFKDIGPMSAEQQEAIKQAVSLGLIGGYPSGEFKPDASLTRTQLAVLLVRALRLPVDTNADSSFKDVAAGSWSAGYIEAVRKAGLMNGTDAGFDPNRNVTRQELASVFVRAVNGENTTGGLETDPALADGASGWAATSVQAALRLGLMTSTANGFEPRQEVARADIAQFLLDIFPEKEQTAAVTKIDGDVITVGGTPLLVSGELKRLLLADGNIEALEGAVLRFKTAVRSVNGLSELEIVAKGTAGSPVKLDTTGMPAGGTLKISGDHVAVSGGTIANLTLQNQVTNVSVDASVDHLELTGEPVTLSGKGQYREIQITNPKAKLTVGADVRIARLVLPDGVALTDIVTNLSQVQAQIGSAVSASGSSLPVPSAPVSYGAPVVADKSALNEVIGEASGIASGAVAGSAEGQYPQSAIDALNEAIEAAGKVKANAQATQTEVDNAAAILRDVIYLFKYEAVHVGTALLEAAIADAAGLIDAAVAGGAEGQYPQGAIDALNGAVEAAEAVKTNAGATQSEVNSALATLRTAIHTFKNAVVHVGTALLEAAIADAANLIDAAVAGGAEGQYPQGAIDALNEAIEAAGEVKADTQATQAEINGAAASLLDAIDAFKNAVVHIDLAQLNAALDEASGLAATAVAGSAEGQYPQGAIDALNEAIEAAGEVKADTQATQAQIDSAETTLLDAIDAFKDDVVHIDLAQLNAALDEASGLADAAVAGSEEGQYPQSAIDALNEAVEAAGEVKADTQATQAEIDGAAASLLDAIDAFKDAVSHLLKASLTDRSFYLNSGRTGTNGDTVLSTEEFETYTKRNIKNYLQIKRGAQSETIQYDSNNPEFNVFNVVDHDNVVGTISVESTSADVQLIEASNGITVHPLEAATESTESALVFTVKEGGKVVSQVTMPIIMDETAPTLIGSAYSDGQFTLTASEPVKAFDSYSYQVEFSESGAAVDYRPLTQGSDFNVNANGNPIVVTLTGAAKTQYIPQSSSKFRIRVTGITDYAGNTLVIDSTVDVPRY
ncbi:S-layer homology domain-containing protein [Cohnella sp. JJ-181]|uniref:S-layer homology domain-containing protein n=1 Tax=Cohnella rhizoplanae TaxID=2974897 RepID=UPI0022FF79C9|nr:S-layer homology domain-containing protein [Cohnella sp. JJ-181]CAI6086564.1 hypothetical protein COHCIP112018_05071 [Cohnella sp. JJ-181]